MSRKPRFLTLQQLISIQQDQVSRYGGGEGIRDSGLLESALAMPKAKFGGQFLHEDLYMMAAAYLYHIVLNHPFVDGNKRVALASALVFLDVNGLAIEADEDEAVDLVLAVIKSNVNKEGIADFLRQNSRPNP